MNGSQAVQRALALMPTTVLITGNGRADDAGQTLSVRVEQRDIASTELFRAREVIDFGGHFCRPVGSINGAERRLC